MSKTTKIILAFLVWAILLFYSVQLVAQEYTANARIDLLGSGGYSYPEKGIGNLNNGKYSFFTKRKAKALPIIAIASFIGGTREGWEDDDRLSFERKGWTNDQYSFFGSKAWDSKWTGFEKLRREQFDFGHMAKDIEDFGEVWAGYELGFAASFENTRKVHKVFDLIGISIFSSVFRWLGYSWARNRL